MKPNLLSFALLVTVSTAMPAQEFERVYLTDNLVLLRGDPNGNVLVRIDNEGLTVVDAQTGSWGEALLAEIGRLSPLPVRMVVNTHYHEDHIGGNNVFASTGALIVGHQNLPLRARVDTTIDELEWHREAADADDLPTVTLDNDASWSPAGASVQVLAFSSAHTDTDLAVFFARENVLHTGDIVEIIAPPFVDWWGGGSLRGVIRAVDRMLAATNTGTRYVPGHGPPLTRADIVGYRDFLAAIESGILNAISNGLTIQETADLDLTAPFGIETEAGRRFVMINYLGLTTLNR